MQIAIDLAAAAAFAAASGFAATSAGGLAVPVAGAAAFVIALSGLRSVPADERIYFVSAFELIAFDPADSGQVYGELLLTSEQILDPPGRDADAGERGPSGEHLLDDVLADVGPGVRVVRLFEPGQIPTAGGLRASLGHSRRVHQSNSAPPDGSQALSDALAQLRRSLQ